MMLTSPEVSLEHRQHDSHLNVTYIHCTFSVTGEKAQETNIQMAHYTDTSTWRTCDAPLVILCSIPTPFQSYTCKYQPRLRAVHSFGIIIHQWAT